MEDEDSRVQPIKNKQLRIIIQTNHENLPQMKCNVGLVVKMFLLFEHLIGGSSNWSRVAIEISNLQGVCHVAANVVNRNSDSITE